MSWQSSRRLLQIVVAVLGLVPVGMGSAGVLLGAASVLGGDAAPVNLDSHYRYLSGIFLGVGVMFYATIPSIERKTFLFRLGTALVFAGGLGRLLSLIVAGQPAAPHMVGLCLELLVVPLLCLWQARIARGAVGRTR